ncbi:hypothetical protein [Escherichia coli]|uniref:hypothetical protein n=1 Tax=Escherichia coli TaxID=562 RepID=UPI002360E6EC|nr:hypothetical protein [Escherichia coli]
MKYLAVLLAILSAGSAWGAALMNYVPTGVSVYANYTRDRGSISHRIYKDYEGAEPVTATLSFTDQTREKTKMHIRKVINKYKGLDHGSITLSGPNGGTLRLNDKYSITAHYEPGYGDGSEQPYIADGDEYLYLPGIGDSDHQGMIINCGVPVKIEGISENSQVTLGSRMLIHPPGDLSPSTLVEVDFECRWHLRAIYSLSLSLDKTVLTIEDKVGSNTIYNNTLRVSGNGGAVLITIDNPMQADISTSFSDSRLNVLTTTAIPTMEGTTVPFYVVAQNTRAGSRTYKVNFTAAYV